MLKSSTEKPAYKQSPYMSQSGVYRVIIQHQTNCAKVAKKAYELLLAGNITKVTLQTVKQPLEISMLYEIESMTCALLAEALQTPLLSTLQSQNRNLLIRSITLKDKSESKFSPFQVRVNDHFLTDKNSSLDALTSIFKLHYSYYLTGATLYSPVRLHATNTLDIISEVISALQPFPPSTTLHHDVINGHHLFTVYFYE